MRSRYWGMQQPKTPEESRSHSPMGTPLMKGGSLRSENHIYFYTEVTPGSTQDLVLHLREAASEMGQTGMDLGISPPPIHLHIQSGGGSLFAGLAALDSILEIREKVPVHTHIEGSAASAATLISLAGTHRTIGKHGYILIHQLSTWFGGKYEELKDEMHNSELLMKSMINFYAEHSTMPPKSVKQALKKDLWFDSNKALKLGLVDEIR